MTSLKPKHPTTSQKHPKGHCWNGFTWRLKLTVKPPDHESGVELNIHVGLCWSVEVGFAAVSLPLAPPASLCCGDSCFALHPVRCQSPPFPRNPPAALQQPQPHQSIRRTPKTRAPPLTHQVAGDPLPINDASVVGVEFSISTHDFTTSEDDPTHSDSPVLIRAGTCWGW